MNDQVIVDASLVFKSLVREELTDETLALLRSWENQKIRLAAPYLMLAEVTNTLHRRVVGGSLTVEAASHLLDNLLSMNIELYETDRLHHRALKLASQFRQGAAYDSHYLALAETLGCHLWTADQRLQRATGPLAPKVHWIGELVS